MSYIINLGSWQSVFAVPAEIVDRHLRLANAAHIKVILFLLRHSGETLDAAAVSNAVGLSESDVNDALAYWQTCGLLAQNDAGELEPPAIEPSAAAEKAAEPAAPAAPASLPEGKKEEANPEEKSEPTSPSPKRVERVRYSYGECAEYISSTEGLREMLLVVEGMMRKQLNHSEISVFVTLVHWYGLPAACVALLVEYCQSIGKGSIAYIEQTGIGWAAEEISTVEQATKKIDRLRSLNSAWNTFRSALDIPERKPTKKEQECCDRWINEYKLDISLIHLAFDRCVDNKGKLSMSYMNGIIENWRKKGITTVEQAEAENAPSQTQPQQNGRFDPTYDKSEIESVMFDEWFADNGDS